MPDESMRDDAWFAPKRYGYGAGLPIAWQGWVIVVGYVALVTAAGMLLPRHPLLFAAVITIATVVLFAITASRTRGGWRWRWGEEG